MKSLEDFIKTNRNDKLSACLIEELKKVPNCDDDFIYGVLVYTKNDADKREMIKFIQKAKMSHMNRSYSTPYGLISKERIKKL